MPKTNNITRKDLEKLLSVNTLLVIVLLLELLIAMYLVLSQNMQIKKLYESYLSEKGQQEESVAEEKEAAATLSLTAPQSNFAAGETADLEITVALSQKETIGTIEGRIKYDPDYVKIQSIITRSLFNKASEKDDPTNGIYSFIFYKKEGETVEKSLGLATLTVTPIRKGNTSLDFILSDATKNTSTVMRYEKPINLLQKVSNLDIVIE